MQKLMVGAALMLCLATPAVAKPAADPVALAAHLDALVTAADRDCYMMKNRQVAGPAASIETCNTAIADLQAKRRSATKASIGELANFDFLESALESGLGDAYSTRDQTLSANTCGAVERSWALRYKLLQVSADDVGAEVYEIYHDIPAQQAELLQMCRTKHGTPANAAPMPG